MKATQCSETVRTLLFHLCCQWQYIRCTPCLIWSSVLVELKLWPPVGLLKKYAVVLKQFIKILSVIFVLYLTKYHAMKTCRNGGIAPCTLNIGIRWRWVVIIPWPKIAWCPLDWRLGGPQSKSGCSVKKVPTLPQIESRTSIM